MSRPLIDKAVFVGALLGVLVVVHLSIMVDRGFDRGCFGFSEPTPVVECEAVIQSDAGTLFGVSNSVWGLVFYLTVVGLSVVVSFGGERRGLARRLRLALVSVGLAYSAYLIYVQATQIGSWCKLCVISACLVAVLFGLVAFDSWKNATHTNPMQGKKLFAGLAIATLAIALVDLAWFSRLAIAQPEVAPVEEAIPADGAVAPTPAAAELAGAVTDACIYDPSISPVEDYQQLVTFSDPFLGNPQAAVQVVEFFDPNCPHCRTMHPIMKRVIETHGETAQFFMIPYIVFQHSLNQIEALYVAAQDGKYFDMIDAQFEVQKASGLTIPELASLAEALEVDPEVFSRRVERGLNRQMIASRRQQISGLGVRGVPTVMINGRIIASEAKSVECLQQMIDEAASE